MLTPLDIRKQDFPQRLRGYDATQVDEFLDLVADEMERLVTERNQLTDRVAAMEAQLAEFRRIEETMRGALMTAQTTQKEAAERSERDAASRIREAEVRAQSIIGESEARAREIIAEAENRRRALVLEVEALETQRSIGISKFKSLLDDQRAVLDAHTNARSGSGARAAAPPPVAAATA